jgi:chromosome segregation ATPase
MANVYINELKQEIEFLKKVNEDLAIKQEKVKESFENNRREVFNLSEKMRELEIDKNSVEETRTILKDENERLIKDYDQIILKNRKFEKENSDLGKKINELNLKLMDFNALQSKLNEFKRNYDVTFLDI